MASVPLTLASLPDWLQALALPRDEAGVLEGALSAPHLFQVGMRASYLAPLELWMGAQAGADAYKAFCMMLPKQAMFDFVPIAQIMLMLAKASSLVFPDQPLAHGMNSVAEFYIAGMANHAMLSAMMATCNHNLFEYLDLVSGAWHLWYNFGSRTNRRLSLQHISMDFQENWTAVSALWQPGLNRGLLRLFQKSGEVTFSALSDTRFTIDIILRDAA